jgi:hypothetical protein
MKKLFLLLMLVSCFALGCQKSTTPATPAPSGTATEDAGSTTTADEATTDETN